jgi:hypothetical protein
MDTEMGQNASLYCSSWQQEDITNEAFYVLSEFLRLKCKD